MVPVVLLLIIDMRMILFSLTSGWDSGRPMLGTSTLCPDLHVGSPNAADRPRMMLTFRYERSNLLQEVATAFGWH